MAQKTFTSEMLTSSDVNTYLMGEGGAWTSWTPTVTQSGSVTVTNTRSRYARYGRTIHFSLQLSVTGSGTGSNAVLISFPVTAASAITGGVGYLTDASAPASYMGILYANSTTNFGILGTGSGYLGSTTFTAALASGDIIFAHGTYEAAS
jgi:hypothetical protein